MNDIQKARDVLKARRAAASEGVWEARVPVRPYTEYADIYAGEEEVAWNADGDGALNRVDADLIVLTAGNPDLLDAIDAILKAALVEVRGPYETTAGTYLAAAILAADERMQQ